MSDEPVVIDVGDLPPGGMCALEARGLPILVCNVGGELFAVENRCPHVGIPLTGGRLRGSVLECPLHGGKFDVRTGRSVAAPIRRPARTFPVRIADGVVAIELETSCTT
jgi:nitrite reductase/ring-hydroxylating ferredoxin subunit